MKSKGIFFIGAAILLITSACQNLIPAPSLNMIPKTNSMAVVENIIPQPVSAEIFSLPAVFCDSSMYVKDVTIEDGTKIKPNTAFIKKWRIKNIGSCGWNKKYSLQFFMGEKMSGEPAHLTKWAPSGKTIVVSINMIAPEMTGAYTGYWILTNSIGTPFGSYFTVKIIVTNKIP
jgi:hypothetical protein